MHSDGAASGQVLKELTWLGPGGRKKGPAAPKRARVRKCKRSQCASATQAGVRSERQLPAPSPTVPVAEVSVALGPTAWPLARCARRALGIGYAPAQTLRRGTLCRKMQRNDAIRYGQRCSERGAPTQPEPRWPGVDAHVYMSIRGRRTGLACSSGIVLKARRPPTCYKRYAGKCNGAKRRNAGAGKCNDAKRRTRARNSGCTHHSPPRGAPCNLARGVGYTA